MSNNETKNYDYITLIKKHSELFTYDPQNDIYHCEEYNMSIGNKKSLQRHIESFCKSKEKSKIGRLFENYKDNEYITANYSPSKSRCCILPLAVAFEGKDIVKQLENAEHLRMQDKYIAGTIESNYDNYLSAEEAADLKEATSIMEKDYELIEME